jgi:hypothetical protein
MKSDIHPDELSDAAEQHHHAADVPRSTLVGWLKLNLGLTMALISIVSACGGALVTGTWRVASWDNRIAKIEEAARLHTERLDKVDVALHAADDRRVELAVDLGRIDSRLGILEQQTKFLGSFVQDNFALKGAARR